MDIKIISTFCFQCLTKQDEETNDVPRKNNSLHLASCYRIDLFTCFVYGIIFLKDSHLPLFPKWKLCSPNLGLYTTFCTYVSRKFNAVFFSVPIKGKIRRKTPIPPGDPKPTHPICIWTGINVVTSVRIRTILNNL